VAFTPKPTILKLVFEDDTPLHGLTVRARPCSIGEWQDMIAWGEEKATSAKDLQEKNDRVAQLFLDHVVEWDMEIPEGKPVPLTLEGWKMLDKDHADILITAWQFAMYGIPKISKNESPDGETSEEQSLDLAKLSESLPNWNPPSSS
jgi:hypothetical protein